MNRRVVGVVRLVLVCGASVVSVAAAQDGGAAGPREGAVERECRTVHGGQGKVEQICAAPARRGRIPSDTGQSFPDTASGGGGGADDPGYGPPWETPPAPPLPGARGPTGADQ